MIDLLSILFILISAGFAASQIYIYSSINNNDNKEDIRKLKDSVKALSDDESSYMMYMSDIKGMYGSFLNKLTKVDNKIDVANIEIEKLTIKNEALNDHLQLLKERIDNKSHKKK